MKFRNILAAFLLISVPLTANEVFIFNSANIANISRMNPIEKDKYILSLQKKTISAKVIIDSIDINNEYKKGYRIISLLQEKNQVVFIFHIYSEKKDYIDLLKKGDTFEFKGQLVLSTPLNTKRDKYILDIILEDGAIVLE
ncbi:MAG: hypothetical protein KA015_01350 [Spirochaetes bacterium]|nr:hypothetical protein [Spirochaetota bacterium]